MVYHSNARQKGRNNPEQDERKPRGSSISTLKDLQKLRNPAPDKSDVRPFKPRTNAQPDIDAPPVKMVSCLMCKKPMDGNRPFGAYTEGPICTMACDINYLVQREEKMMTHPAKKVTSF